MTKQRRFSHTLATLALVCSLLAIAALPTPAGAVEAGVNIPAPTPAAATGLKALGAHWVRMFISWRSMEPSPGGIDPNVLAHWEGALAQLPAGTKVIFDVFDTPQWETGSADEHAPPANPQDYADFVATLAKHFAPWAAAFEIWNEEDSPVFWSGGPDPAAYVRLLKAAYPAIKAADPAATVLVGGLTGNDYPFVESIYAAGGKGSFDAVAVHTDTACNILSPYEFLRDNSNRMIVDSFLAYREVHAVMVANGDAKPIWMTELSWRTTGATCAEGAWAGQKAAGVTEEQQATFLQQAYHCMSQDSYVQVALWFPMDDEGSLVSGLVRADGTHKPSWAALRSYLRSGDRLNESCGVFTGPKITVASPANHSTYSGPLPIRVSASSSQGVFRIRLEVDGRLIRNYDGKTYPSTLDGAITWQGAKHIPFGQHVLTFLAYDRQRNVSQTSIVVYHAKPAPKIRRHAKRRHARRHGKRHH